MRSVLDAMRSKVSADKNRYVEGEYSLDLTYITDRIIAMSFPAEGVESAYRNNGDEVARMLRENHGDNFMIYNLSEREYDYSKFNNQVHDWCGFPDHHAPPLRLLFQIVRSIHSWLLAGKSNVVVVHCLAGKGRTGTVIVAYLLFCGVFRDYRQGLAYFAAKRSSNNWGVTGPSQVRALEYFERILIHGAQPRFDPVTLQYMMFSAAPAISSSSVLSNLVGVSSGATCTPFVHIYQESMGGNSERELIWSSEAAATSTPSAGRDGVDLDQDLGTGGAGGAGLRTYAAGQPIQIPVPDVTLQGDILLEVYHMTGWYRTERIVRCSFSTQMLDSNVLHLPLLELDDAVSDKRFQSDFFIDMGFDGIPDARASREAGGDTPAPDRASSDALDGIWWSNEQEGNGSLAFSDPEMCAEARRMATSAPDAGATLEKGGWLTKRGHNVKNWKRRWFVLKDPTLCYYNKPRDTTPQGVILLDDILTVLSEQNMFHDANDSNTGRAKDDNFWFEIITRKNSFLIRADTERDLADWVSSIEFAVAHASSQKNLSRRSQHLPPAHAPPAARDIRQTHSVRGGQHAETPIGSAPGSLESPRRKTATQDEAGARRPSIGANRAPLQGANGAPRRRMDTLDELDNAVRDVENSLEKTDASLQANEWLEEAKAEETLEEILEKCP